MVDFGTDRFAFSAGARYTPAGGHERGGGIASACGPLFLWVDADGQETGGRPQTRKIFLESGLKKFDLRDARGSIADAGDKKQAALNPGR